MKWSEIFMEEINGGSGRGDLQNNAFRPSSMRPSGSLKTSLSGRSTPRGSPAFRRLHSSRTPRRDARQIFRTYDWIRGNRLVFWLFLITLWTYLGFYIQSRWAHLEHPKTGFIGYQSKAGIANWTQSPDQIENSGLVLHNVSSDQVKGSVSVSNLKKFVVRLAKKRGRSSSHSKPPSKKSKRSTSDSSLHATSLNVKQKGTTINENNDFDDIPRKNTSYGLIVGPFGKTEDSILGWSPEKRTGTCDRKSSFARLVWSRKFMLIFHELSMTGAPLSMMELATELMSCGATVSAVVLSRKGGLLGELSRRGIKVLPDKAELSYKTAIKADLVIAGSAVCESWIDQYLSRFPVGFNQIAWWIMENRKEYFDRSKSMLNRVRMLIFLSDAQLKQWLVWCDEEKIKLKAPPPVVPLSVNDELAFVAGINCSLNTPSFSVEKMQEKKQHLRDAVRKEMGLTSNDMLIMALSSINPGKGQLLLLDSARLAVEGLTQAGDVLGTGISDSNLSNFVDTQHSRGLLHENGGSAGMNGSSLGSQRQSLKILIGSLGSKSSKVPYVKGILRFLSQHPNISKSVLWTPATTRVASLYAAADVYVINSQGLGETFGRVTIEAMAFGLPVLGTDAGGTKEIVEHNVTGLLHPVGHLGNQVLARNIQYFLDNPSIREEMASKGKSEIEKKYLKNHMYGKLAKIFAMCMRIK